MAKTRLTVGINDLASQYPEIAKEFDLKKNYPLTPQEVSAKTDKTVWWKCSKGHSYQSIVGNRTAKGSGCPYCAGQKVQSGINDLASQYPEVAKEFDLEKNHPLTAQEVSAKNQKKVWWKCDKGHSYQSSIYHRTRRGQGCSYCSGRKVLAGFNDIESQNPKMASEFDIKKNFPLIPSEISKGMNIKVWWKCSEGHSYQCTIVNKTKGRGCPICAKNKKIIKGNDFVNQYFHIVKEFDVEKNYPLTPQEITPKTNKKIWWKCKAGHSYKSAVVNRIGSGSGCPYCSGKKVLVGFNDLETTHPELAKEFDVEKNAPLTLQELSAGCHKKVWWKCNKEHFYQSTVLVKTTGGGCPYCSGKKVLVGFNDLETTHPELAKEFDVEKNAPLTLQEISVGGHKKVWWKCSEGHSYQSVVKNRVKSGCPYCSGNKILEGYNDLATTHPKIASEFDVDKNLPLTLKDISMGKNSKIWWKCGAGHSYQATVNNRVSNNSDCPYCVGSKGERCVWSYLSEMGIDFNIEHKFLDYEPVSKFPFDVYILHKKLIIEIDGIQHFDKNNRIFNQEDGYEKLILHCNIKNSYCLDKSIPILRIPYVKYDEQTERFIKSMIDKFLETQIVPDNVLLFYKDNDDSNYYEIAKK